MAVTKINLTLLSAAAATGTPLTLQKGGDFCFAVNGTFGGTTVSLQMLGPDNLNYITIKDTAGAIAITAADAVVVSIPAGTYRATITGGTGVSVSAFLRSIG